MAAVDEALENIKSLVRGSNFKNIGVKKMIMMKARHLLLSLDRNTGERG